MAIGLDCVDEGYLNQTAIGLNQMAIGLDCMWMKGV